MKTIKDFSKFILKSYLKKKINDIDWHIIPIGEYHGKEFHNREINLNLLNDEIDSENYSYESCIEVGFDSCDFTYQNNCLLMKSTRMEYGEKEKMDMTFEEACVFIKKREKIWKDIMC